MKAAYTGQIKVRFADTDANGHTYFGSYLVLADEVVSEYLEQVGWDAGPDGDFLTFTANANIDFVGECLAWDILDVSCSFTRLGNSSCTLECEMPNTTTNEIATVLEAQPIGWNIQAGPREDQPRKRGGSLREYLHANIREGTWFFVNPSKFDP